MAYVIKQHRGQAVTSSGLDVLAALWLVISPLFLSFHRLGDMVVVNIILGLVIGILALYRIFTPTNASSWASWVNLVLGVCVLASPWAMGYAYHRPSMASNGFVGLIVVVVSLWGALASTAHTRCVQDDMTPPEV